MRRLKKVALPASMAWLALGWPADAADTGTVAKKRVLVIAFSKEKSLFTVELVQIQRRKPDPASPHRVEVNIEFAGLLRQPDDV
jgi:hypothetical protein